MNDILLLKGSFDSKPNSQRPSAPKLPSNQSVSSDHLRKLAKNLIAIASFWKEENFLPKVLLSAHYRKVAAKSNRIDAFFSFSGSPSEQSIVGAKYGGSPSNPVHIITYYVSIDVINESIKRAQEAAKILDDQFNGIAKTSTFNDSRQVEMINFKRYQISKSMFQRLIVDASYVDEFSVDKPNNIPLDTAIITFYDTQIKMNELLSKLGLNPTIIRALDETSVLLTREDIELVVRKAPYLIAMATVDFSRFCPGDFTQKDFKQMIEIPDPTDEPTIGVIDTLFDSSVYFARWVDQHNLISEEIEIQPEDYLHGTSVCSLIVDGPSLNPELEDGCGRFKVRHFGVALCNGFSSYRIINQIKDIIAQNRDIRVWNLSLGSNDEVNRNFVSAEAAILDQIQYENDVLFVISGTNKKSDESQKRIGAPADSINAIVVNSVRMDTEPASYSRSGPVLSFFTKPDVSYYGGDRNNKITVCDPVGTSFVSGTSYAAPWITRKMSFLIDVLGFNREIAKSLIIDAAIGWDEINTVQERSVKGHGVVPIRIEDIVKSQEDEIKFVVFGVSEKYETFNYRFAVPKHKNEYPFIAKATMCYFPRCSRNQGVDYTNTELDLYFGRITDKNTIKSINNNKQCIEDGDIHPVFEADARKFYRKWDNIKHISDEVKERNKSRTVFEGKVWGMKVVTKERLKSRDGIGIRFGVVVTLKEIHGVNRIEDFIQQCSLRGWLVNRINVDNRIKIFTSSNEKVEFD